MHFASMVFCWGLVGFDLLGVCFKLLFVLTLFVWVGFWYLIFVSFLVCGVGVYCCVS